ncbi:alpha/beta-hydrolase [Panaeolus papilionaceus]|nr:alpha/beta-hydrolase [Panaeolus papilionaceus]
MHSALALTYLALVCLFWGVTASPIDSEVNAELAESNIPAPLYDTLTWYFKYASSAYTPFTACARPNGNTRVTGIWDLLTDTQGFIARDDNRKEIVVSFRGTTSPIDILTDINIFQVPFVSPGVSAPGDVRVHKGFLKSWNAVAPSVIQTVRAQLSGRTGYSIVTTGHSLGGALSSISAVALKSNFPNVPVRMYTYGQPRTGNPSYASWINANFGTGKAFRVTHTTDPVVQIPTKAMGFAHHGVEYWIRRDLASPANVDSCNPNGEDKNCSDKVPLLLAAALLPAHLVYMNIPSFTPFCI